MKEIEFSAMNIFPNTQSEGALMSDFKARYQTSAKLQYVDWDDAWNLLVRCGLNGQGPDVSEIGSTWLGGLHAMDALRPFNTSETTKMGGGEAFQPSMWQACHFGRENLLLAMPLTIDLRVVLYRRDWLQKAGVNEETAFMDSDHFADTVKSVKAAGHPSPLAIPTSHSLTRLIHDLACWVWSAGGEIRSNDGRHMLLMEPASRAGIHAYFSLNEFISPEMQALAESTVFDAFTAGKCAIAVLSERGYTGILTESVQVNPEVRENVGLSMMMKAPFVGGTALGIWRYSHNYEGALKLVQYLTSAEAWAILNQQEVPHTSARRDILEHSKLASSPFYPAILKSLAHGRSFQSGYRWSGVESRLVAVIESLWGDLRANPGLDIAREIEERFAPVCMRLEQTLLAS